jgi:hypothetical protein
MSATHRANSFDWLQNIILGISKNEQISEESVSNLYAAKKEQEILWFRRRDLLLTTWPIVPGIRIELIFPSIFLKCHLVASSDETFSSFNPPWCEMSSFSVKTNSQKWVWSHLTLLATFLLPISLEPDLHCTCRVKSFRFLTFLLKWHVHLSIHTRCKNKRTVNKISK